MMRFILCEGKTDAILLSYYLCRTKGWQHNKKPQKFRANVEKDNEGVFHYSKDKEELAICCVGGKDNFTNFYSKYIKSYIVDSENDDREYKIAIVVDKDNRSIEEIEKSLSKSIIKVVNQKWNNSFIKNKFDQEITICSLCVVIPQKQQGALENLLLDALSEDEYKGNIIEKSKLFVDSIIPIADRIITSERLKLKTKLGVSMAVLYPEKVFDLIDEQLKSIHWEKSETINECFKCLIDI